ncbi:MAG: hypothetical protein LBO72_08515 [Helicobacteraceae bacterium]|nr:hypothetical protein [Helicobacteraceae bacterium]
MKTRKYATMIALIASIAISGYAAEPDKKTVEDYQRQIYAYIQNGVNDADDFVRQIYAYIQNGVNDAIERVKNKDLLDRTDEAKKQKVVDDFVWQIYAYIQNGFNDADDFVWQIYAYIQNNDAIERVKNKDLLDRTDEAKKQTVKSVEE